MSTSRQAARRFVGTQRMMVSNRKDREEVGIRCGRTGAGVEAAEREVQRLVLILLTCDPRLFLVRTIEFLRDHNLSACHRPLLF
jgi:hypothetical protein